ncbi:MAG TPA: RidA family protein [Woeseiaceae bacterium]|nr:RidA family protein [Woeseiaceae bacterium]
MPDTSHSIERRLAGAGLTLPEAPAARANYVPSRVAGKLVYLAGQGPAYAETAPSFGKVGGDLTLEQGVDAAARTALSVLAVLKSACDGDLSKVKQCVQLTAFVNSAPGFVEQPAVVDGATNVLALAFGDAGLPARAAVAAPELPFNFAVEIQAVFELR